MIIEAKLLNGSTLQSLESSFERLSDITSIVITNTPNVKFLSHCFYFDTNLSDIFIDYKSIPKISGNGLDGTFFNTRSLYEGFFDDFISNRDTSELNSLKETFKYSNLIISPFDTSNVEDIQSCFYGAREIKGGWNFDNVIDASYAFSNCNSSTFPVINFPNCTNFYSTWAYSQFTSFPTIDVSNGVDFGRAWGDSTLNSFPSDTNGVCTLDFGNATNMDNCFIRIGVANMPKLNINTNKYCSIDNIFYSSNMITFGGFNSDAKIVGYKGVFVYSELLECIDGDLPRCSTGVYWQAFDGCERLRSIRSIDTTGLTSSDYMFNGCTSLVAPNTTEQQQLTVAGGAVYFSGIDCSAK